MTDFISTTEARQEGFYWVILGQNPPEIAYWERGEWWLAGDPKPWQPEAVTVASDRLVFRPRLGRADSVAHRSRSRSMTARRNKGSVTRCRLHPER